MLRVLTCLTVEHDGRLVVLAVAICLLSCIVAISLFHRAQATRGRVQVIWLALGTATVSSGIWATHFVAMLAYDPGFGFQLRCLPYGLVADPGHRRHIRWAQRRLVGLLSVVCGRGRSNSGRWCQCDALHRHGRPRSAGADGSGSRSRHSFHCYRDCPRRGRVFNGQATCRCAWRTFRRTLADARNFGGTFYRNGIGYDRSGPHSGGRASFDVSKFARDRHRRSNRLDLGHVSCCSFHGSAVGSEASRARSKARYGIAEYVPRTLHVRCAGAHHSVQRTLRENDGGIGRVLVGPIVARPFQASEGVRRFRRRPGGVLSARLRGDGSGKIGHEGHEELEGSRLARGRRADGGRWLGRHLRGHHRDLPTPRRRSRTWPATIP